MSCVGRAALATLHDVKKSIFVTFLFLFGDECVTLLRPEPEGVRSDFQPGQSRSFMMCEDVFRLINFMFRFSRFRPPLPTLHPVPKKTSQGSRNGRLSSSSRKFIFLERLKTLSSKQRSSTGKRFFSLCKFFTSLWMFLCWFNREDCVLNLIFDETHFCCSRRVSFDREVKRG